MNYKQLYDLLQNQEIEQAKKLLLEQIVINDSKNKSTTKALIKLSKHIQKQNIKDNRKSIAGAIYNDKDTFLIDFCILFVAYNEQLQGLVMVDEIDNPQTNINYNKILLDTQNLECAEINKNDLLEAIANKEQAFKVSKYNFDCNYLKLVLDCFENPKIYECNYMIQFEENNKKALLMGLRDC